MSETCEHGALRNQTFPDGFESTEPTLVCSCCGSQFYTIESSMSEALNEEMTRWRHTETTWEPADRCEVCGGQPVTTVSEETI